MTIGDFKNVVYDENSDYQFSDLNETVFLSIFFDRLRGEMREDFYNYMFIVFSSHSTTKLPFSINKDFGLRKVLIFMSEERGVYPLHLAKDFYAVFKSYLNPNEGREKNVFPFPLGYTKRFISKPLLPAKERKIDVFFTGQLSSNRAGLYHVFFRFKFFIPTGLIKFLIFKFQKIKTILTYPFWITKPKTFFIHFTDGFRKGFSGEKYSELLAESKIVFCPSGVVSTQTFRHFEAMKTGCIIISERLPEYEFYRNSPMIQVENWEEGIRVANALLKDEPKLNELQQKTIDWWQTHCSEEAISKYMITCMQTLKENN